MTLNIRTAFVTGGTGFLGAAIVDRLLEAGVFVKCFSRRQHPHEARKGVEYIQGDIGNAAEVLGALSPDVDLVFHTAALAGLWGQYDSYYSANVSGTKHVLEACLAHGISRLVYTSSPSVVSTGRDLEGVDESCPIPTEHNAFYPQTKAMAEELVLSANGHKLSTVALRPHLIWGPGDNHIVPRIIRRARSGKLRLIGGGRKLIDTIYIDNAVTAHLLAAERLSLGSPIAGKTYFLSNDEPMPIADVINGILRAAHMPPVQRTLSPFMAHALGGAMEGFYKTFSIRQEPPLTRFLADELGSAHWFDISAAKSDLNYRAEVSISEGLLRLETWLKSNPIH